MAFGPKRTISRGATPTIPTMDRDGQRQQRRAAGERAEPDDLLKVEVGEEEHRGPGGAEHERRDLHGSQVGRLEDAQPHRRLPAVGLEDYEQTQQREADDPGREGGRGHPAGWSLPVAPAPPRALSGTWALWKRIL